MTDEGSIGWTGYAPLDGLLSGELRDGVVREWHDEQGWGVIDSPETPGGCWTHFSAIVSAGYRQLSPGSSVAFTTEQAQQDGYSYRAVQVFPGAYRSSLTITVDGDAVDPETVRLAAEREVARERLAILDAVVTAGDRRNEVMAVIADADSSDGARAAVAELLGVTDVGAAAVLDLQLRRFSREAMQRLRAERDELRGDFEE